MFYPVTCNEEFLCLWIVNQNLHSKEWLDIIWETKLLVFVFVHVYVSVCWGGGGSCVRGDVCGRWGVV